MKEKENFDINSDIQTVDKIKCEKGNTTDFFRSLTYQIGGIFGLSSPLSRLDPTHKTIEEIQELQSTLQSVRWQCYQHLLRYIKTFNLLSNFIVGCKLKSE